MARSEIGVGNEVAAPLEEMEPGKASVYAVSARVVQRGVLAQGRTAACKTQTLNGSFVKN